MVVDILPGNLREPRARNVPTMGFPQVVDREDFVRGGEPIPVKERTDLLFILGGFQRGMAFPTLFLRGTCGTVRRVSEITTPVFQFDFPSPELVKMLHLPTGSAFLLP